MADYNVNMKQWNGTSFDNVLPLAYNAKNAEALAGSSLGDIQQWVKDNGLLLYTGQYTGTGTYGASNPISIQFPFEPKLFIFPISAEEDYPISSPLDTGFLTTSYKQVGRVRDVSTRGALSGNYLMAKFSNSARTKLQIYSTNNAKNQSNESSVVYYFAAIGGYDMGGQTEWTITQSGTWIVPRTGRYMLELYGGGGGSSRLSNRAVGYTAGSSCQHYDSVVLTAGNAIAVAIGSAGASSESGSQTTDGTATTFGSYSVDGGGKATNGNYGAGAGNYGNDGAFTAGGETIDRISTNGYYGTKYGAGSGWYGAPATAGAVYLKYLGA